MVGLISWIFIESGINTFERNLILHNHFKHTDSRVQLVLNHPMCETSELWTFGHLDSRTLFVPWILQCNPMLTIHNKTHRIPYKDWMVYFLCLTYVHTYTHTHNGSVLCQWSTIQDIVYFDASTFKIHCFFLSSSSSYARYYFKTANRL